VRRDEVAAQLAVEQQPLHMFQKTHVEALRYSQDFGWGWNCVAPNLPGMLREMRAVERARLGRPETTGPVRSAEDVTRLIRTEANRLGLSAIGFAPYDPRYTFEEYRTDEVTSVIVVTLEQDYAATQSAPSGRAERAAFRAYTEVLARVAPLAEFIHGLGFAARPQDFSGEAIMIHYGVHAGLGQLGLNGQLLTPQAGSRCRLSLISTNAPVVHDGPVDYGIEAICDQCQACVRRCPVSAIPNTRKQHRGVVKIKIKTERCYPTIIQTHGCSVCMKVCPVQRYGLARVHEHFEQTGEILGRGTDELEGYEWPLDGRFYGVGRARG
jgi:ferredoxin